MARQRQVRPEYFRDRMMGKLGPVVGTVYQALWVWADDGGVARCDPQVLKAECFLWWPDMTIGTITDALARLAGAHRVKVYAIGEDLYAEIPTIAKHSPVSHPGKFRYPRDGQAVTDLRGWLSGQLSHDTVQPLSGDSPASVPSVLPLPVAVAVTESIKGKSLESSAPDVDKPAAPVAEAPAAARPNDGLRLFAEALAPHDRQAREYLERQDGDRELRRPPLPTKFDPDPEAPPAPAADGGTPWFPVVSEKVTGEGVMPPLGTLTSAEPAA